MSVGDIRNGIVLLIGLIISVALHEFGHAWVAWKLGDPTPERDGRVTLNPIAHMDIVGTLILPAVMIFMFPSGILFGWGKPVMTNPYYYRRSVSMRTGEILVSLAGPGMNLVLAVFFSLLIGVLMRTGIMSPHDPMLGALTLYVYLNLVLMLFNLLPFPPLDGSHVLFNLLGPGADGFKSFMAQYGMWILIILMISGALSWVLQPVMWLGRFMVGLAVGAGI